MPHYLGQYQIYIALWPLLATAILLGLVGGALLWLSKGKKRFGYWFDAAVVFTFSFLGITAGFLSGLSRESVLGEVIPAILGLIGAVSIFVFQKEKADRRLICAMIVSLSFALLIGSLWGAAERQYSEEMIQSTVFAEEPTSRPNPDSSPLFRRWIGSLLGGTERAPSEEARQNVTSDQTLQGPPLVVVPPSSSPGSEPLGPPSPIGLAPIGPGPPSSSPGSEPLGPPSPLFGPGP